MPSGALRELEGRGPQDRFWTHRPQFSYFRGVYRRHTDFAVETSTVYPQQSVQRGGEWFEFFVPNFGDVVAGMRLEFTMPALTVPAGSTYAGYTNGLAHALVEYVELEIGGDVVNRVPVQFLELFDELSLDESQRTGKYLAIGEYEIPLDLETNATAARTYYLDLHTLLGGWKTRAPRADGQNLFFPIGALHEYRTVVRVRTRTFEQCVVYDGATAPSNPTASGSVFQSCALLVDYVYLNEAERVRIARGPHVLAIEQVQELPRVYVPATTTSSHIAVPLTFNHAVRELVWVLREAESEDNNDWFNFGTRSDADTPLAARFGIVVDGHPREEEHGEAFWRIVTPARAGHSRIPTRYVYCLGFDVDTENATQGSGALTFSRFDSIKLSVYMQDAAPASYLYVYARSWNVLVFSKGLSGLLYYT